MEVDEPLTADPMVETNAMAPGAAETLAFTVYANNAVGGTYDVSVEAFHVFDNTTALASYMVDDSPPDAPLLDAELSRKNRAKLSWTASQDAGIGLDHYAVYRDGTRIATTTSTSYNDTGLAGGTTYSYVVDAVDGAGNAASSNPPAEVTTAGKGGGGSSDGGSSDGGGSDGGGSGGSFCDSHPTHKKCQ